MGWLRIGGGYRELEGLWRTWVHIGGGGYRRLGVWGLGMQRWGRFVVQGMWGETKGEDA